MTAPRPEGISREEAIANLTHGKILYLSTVFPDQLSPQNKYFVVVGFDKRPLLLKINTSSKFAKTQFVIKRTTYTFLDYDSYLDCGRVWYILSYEEVLGQLMANPKKCIIGEISKDHANEIVRLTNLSKSVTPNHKRIIAESLRPKED